MKKLFLLALVVLFAVAAPVAADTLNISGGTTWKPWVTPAETGGLSAPAFWDTVSWDGRGCNVGFWVTNTAGCGYTNFFTNTPNFRDASASRFFLGNGEFSFTQDGLSSLTGIAAAAGASGLSADTEFGWFNTAKRTDTHPLLIGGVPVVGFDVPSGDYGFYAHVTAPRFPGGSVDYYSDTLVNGRSQFVIFDVSRGGTTRYAFGFEDLTNPSDYDYNDVMGILSYESTPVPEPGTIALLGIGLVGVARAVRRRK